MPRNSGGNAMPPSRPLSQLQPPPRAPLGHAEATSSANPPAFSAGIGEADARRTEGAHVAPAIGGDAKMAINCTNQSNVAAGQESAGRSGAAAAVQQTVQDAWESLGTRMRRYIIMQHGQIDSSSARDASELPWAAVRGAIEDVNDEFDGDAAEAAVLAAAGGPSGGGLC